MFSADMIKIAFSVLKSWQVLAITVSLILYICLVNYVARTYRRPHSVSKSRPKKSAVKAAAQAAAGPSEATDKANTNEALGLEEAAT
ncbi:MAG: hypothetical protein FWH38_04515 [Treponema sp.]|nr:hypothetical protein [Treponema sp.]